METCAKPLVLCDLTQSYAPHGGGGIGTYLREKRKYVLENTPHTLLQIVPGPEDRIMREGRHIWVEVGAEQVRGSPNYRFIMRTRIVREVLERFRPDLIESQCPWVLPWTAINYRRAFPQTALVAGYHTDFPNAHVHRVGSELFGEFVGRGLRRLATGYAQATYREFDRVYTLSAMMAEVLRGYRVNHVDVLSLGVDTGLFHPDRRDRAWRQELGLSARGPLLVYAGRIDNEKRADRLLTMFQQLPRELDAGLVMIGDGKLRDALIAQARGLQVSFPGFVAERAALARALASADIYVSAMADETFGISIIEAQSSGLPVVGAASGAMLERVVPGTGALVAVDDTAAMAQAVTEIWLAGATKAGMAARAHVTGRFEWRQTFEQLLGEVYPRALASARARNEKSRPGAGAALGFLPVKRIRQASR